MQNKKKGKLRNMWWRVIEAYSVCCNCNSSSRAFCPVTLQPDKSGTGMGFKLTAACCKALPPVIVYPPPNTKSPVSQAAVDA